MERRKFLQSCAIGCAGTVSILTTLESCGTAAYYAKTTTTENKLVIPKSEFVQIKGDKSIPRKYVLVRPAGSKFPVSVYKLDENNYSALLMECTHKGCELQAHATNLVCPCHGSEFSNTGAVLSPPADQNLKTYSVTSDQENIYLHF
jgi:cytochrome b6-f complex iron-sulfur subunit